MIFATFPAAVVVLGGLLIAAALYLLQQLRVRPRVLRLPAAALWRQAAGEMPPRVLRQRFRNWMAYLLALLIALLLWLAAAGPEAAAPQDGRAHLFYLDASARMMDGEAFARARRALLADVATVPAGRREVYLGDAWNSKLLDADERSALLSGRLDGIEAGAHPSAFAPWLAEMAARAGAGAEATVHYYGAASVARDAGAKLPEHFTLVHGPLAGAVADNRGIVNLGAAPAASGAWDRVDVLLETAASGTRPVGVEALRISLDGKEIDPAAAVALKPGRFLLQDLDADGGELAVDLREGDGFAADDSAALRLPQRRRIAVAATAGVPPVVRDVLAVDPALRLGEAGDAEVLVRLDSEPDVQDRPALVLTGPASQAAAFVFAYRGDAERAALADDLARPGAGRLGLARMDATALADRLGREIAIDLQPAARRSVSVWGELFAEDAGFAGSAAMPLFVSQSLRWLAGQPAWIPYAQAGRPLPDQSALHGQVEDTVLLERRLGGSGVYLGEAGAQRLGERPLAVSLVDRQATLAAAEAIPGMETAAAPGARASGRFVTWLLLAAGLLLALEWVLFQRGRMP
ncbi:hypothetical protein LDO31_06430 [Luteimonas sp. XNQY3]|nr:hypothetical protein [Luteimonas sp. XNQY3]MCD9005877.1 hypothetical protein [Luteimonas sp. XNQY3]